MKVTNPTPNLSQFLKLPLAIAVSSCLLTACQSTPKAVTPISEAPANTQAQQPNYTPISALPTPTVQTPTLQTPQPIQTQPVIQLPNIGQSQNTTPASSIGLDNQNALNTLLSARKMSLVEGDTATLQMYGSVWNKLIHGFRISANSTRIENEKVWFFKNKNYLTDVSSRASHFLYHTVSEAERRGIPTELALLPILESSYDPSAYESSANATGLWQLVPSTARVYGLTQSSGYDARRDVIESTRAAYDFLTSLYNQFGSWELALAAYNAGPSRVQAAINANKDQNLPTDYWSLNLPAEAMVYVPRFLALTQILANTQQYGVSLPNIANRPHFRGVPVHNGVALYDIAKLTDVSIEELELLNAGLLSSRVVSPAPNRVLIPNRVPSNLDEQISRLGSNVPASEPTTSANYVVAYRNFGANPNSEHILRQTRTLPTTGVMVTADSTVTPLTPLTHDEKTIIINQLNNAGPIVSPISQNDGYIQLLSLITGQSVLDGYRQSKRLQYSPSRVVVEPVNTSAVSAPTLPTVLAPAPVAAPAPVVAQPTPAPAAPVSVASTAIPDTHVVLANQSIVSIAEKYNLNADDLANWNGVKKDSKLVAGSTLLLKPAAKPTPVTTTPQKVAPDLSDVKWVDYKVKKGDALSIIASRYGIASSQLAYRNKLPNNFGLREGQVIKVPSKPLPKVSPIATPNPIVAQPTPTTAPTTPPAPAPAVVTPTVSVPAPTVAATANPAPRTTISKKGVYKVKAGESLGQIAERFGTTRADIAALNTFTINAKLATGQLINMPIEISSETGTTSPTQTPKAETKTEPKPIKSTGKETQYTVVAGDTLIGVAIKHGVSRSELAKLNTIGENDFLQVGETLLIPAKSDPKSTPKTEPKSEQKAAPKPTASTPTPTVISKTFKNTEPYTVKAGDSLSKLARSYKVSVEDLAKTNDLTPTAGLVVGQTIKVPVLTYTVKSGDSLSKLARSFGVSIDELAKQNNLTANDALKVGQKLTVPAH